MSERNSKMTYVEIMQLLNAYRRNECLWNHAHSNYRNQAIRSEAFTNISIEMDIISIEEVKRRIKILRDTYNIEKNKMRKSRLAGTGRYYTTKIPWFKAADEFLSRCDGKQINPINTSGIPCKSEQSSQQSDEDSSSKSEEQDSPDPLWQYSDVYAGEFANETRNSRSSTGRKRLLESSPSATPAPRQKVFRSAQHSSSYANGNSWSTDGGSSHRQLIQSKRESVSSSIAQPIQDEFLYFGLNLAAQLGELPKLRALMLQEKIQTLVSQERIEFEMSQQPTIEDETTENCEETAKYHQQ